MRFDIVTIFPSLLESPLEEGILRRARTREQIEVNLINLREYGEGVHQMTDDRPFGGGEGMVMKPEPLAAAVTDCRKDSDCNKVILLSPQGRTYDQKLALDLTQEDHLILVCGRYEGVDQRFIDRYVDMEISIGDFILTGGELGAMILVDSITRLLPGVLGCCDSADRDTFSRNLLKHKQFTRPRSFEDVEVPDILLSGDHQKVEDHRFVESVLQTLKKRPDLLKKERFTAKEIKLLERHGLRPDNMPEQH